MNQLVMVIEDEQKIALVLQEFLQGGGYDVELVSTGDGAPELISARDPSLVILDLMLPGKDGLTICREVRATSEVPIIMLTARVDEIDRLLGLELGADDYICKPFSPREVVARVRAILRRVSQPTQPTTQQTLNYLHISLIQDQYQCLIDDVEIDLTPVEFRMLQTLISAPGRVFSRDKLMSQAYSDYRIVSDRTIDSHIKNLRKKLTLNDTYPDVVKSIYSVGYKLE